LTTKRLLLFSLFLLAALALSACGTQVPVNNWPGLAADAEKAYVASGSFVYGVNLNTGAEVWRYPAEADGKLLFYANPVLTPDGQLLIGSAGHQADFVSIDPATGRDKWAQPFAGAKGIWVAPPLVMNELIYAPNADGFLYVLDTNGTLVDQVELGGALWSAPVTDGTSIYVASLDHHLHIVDPRNLQSFKTVDLGGAIPGGVTINSEGVYAGTFASRLEFVTANGQHQSLAEAEGWIWGAPTLDGETLYYADLEGNVYSFDLASTTMNWSGVKPDGPIAASPLVIGDEIFVATESGTLVALDRDGKFQSYEIGGKIYTTPVLVNDMILIAPYQADFALVALNPDGKQAWKFTPAK
jgi:outer membrane protein assembly factor BamB